MTPAAPPPRVTTKAQALPLLDPAHWQQVFLGRKLWQMQQDIVRAVMTEPVVAVKGCHASGKSWAAAGLPLFYLLRHKTNSRVFTTGPTQRQVKTFWREIFSAWTSSRVRSLLPEPQTMGLTVAPDRYAFGASSSAGVNIQGPHAENFLIIADEAPGIVPEVWDAIEGMRAGGNIHMLVMGNPVIPSGQFFEYFTRNRATTKCFSISAFDTPNFAQTYLDIREPDGSWKTLGDRAGRNLLELTREELAAPPPFPALITRQWVAERYHVWGPNHPKFRSRVLAEFPQQSPYAVFDLSWIEAAQRDATEAELSFARQRGACIQCGLDVAGPGDDETVLTARVNGMILGQWAWNDADPRYSVLRQISGLRLLPYPFGCVVVDITGIGYHFATWLADQSIPVYGFQAGATPIDQHQYANLKSEAYFEVREHFKRGLVSGLADEECQAQLSTLQYRETDRGLTAIETKDDARKRGVPSPDRAESLIMAFFRVRPREIHVETQWHRVRISPI